MSFIKKTDRQVYDAIVGEKRRQHNNLELIASENYATESVMEAQGCVLTNKYAEGYPGCRYYAGCENVDEVEKLAIERANKLFGSDYSNVQPHSGVSANLAIFLGILNCGDKILSMNLRDGGHLSHGHKQNLSGRYYEIHKYCVNPETEMIDYENVRILQKPLCPN